MKKIIILIAVLTTAIGFSQITLRGCNAALSDQDYTLTQTNTTVDAGVIRNTFESLPADFTQSCNAGVCEVRIIWSIDNQRWEIQLDNDGPITTPDYTTGILYYNTTASYPNPPDLTLGTWVDNLGLACGGDNSISKLLGDVQSTVLSINEAFLNAIKIYPNPLTNLLNIKNKTGSIIEKVSITDINGRTILNLKFDKYFSKKIIDVSELDSGFYLLNLTSNIGTGTKKLIIQ